MLVKKYFSQSSAIFILFFIWRAFLFLPLVIGYLFLPYRSGYEYTNLWKFTAPYTPVDNFLLFPWANFDGVHYLSIASSGYEGANGRFFPFYPILIWLSTAFFGGDRPFGPLYFFSAFFISNAAFLLALYFFYKLLRLDYQHSTSLVVVVFLLVFPTSFFYGAIFTESLFLLLAVLSFYCARRGEWGKASFFAMLLTASRITGICILPALIFEFVTSEHISFSLKKLKNKTAVLKKALPLFAVPLGLLSFVLYNVWKWHDPLHFVHAHAGLSNGRVVNGIALTPITIYHYLQILITNSLSQYEWWIALLELSCFFFAGIFLIVAWRKRVRTSYLLFAFLCFLIPSVSGTFSGLPRYAAILFPLYIGLVLVQNRVLKVTYLVISSILLFILLLLFSRGYFVS